MLSQFILVMPLGMTVYSTFQSEMSVCGNCAANDAMLIQLQHLSEGLVMTVRDHYNETLIVHILTWPSVHNVFQK